MPVQKVEVKQKKGKPKVKYYFSVYYTDVMGERKRYKSKKYDEKDVAKKEEAKFLLQQNGNTNAHSSLTFNDIYNEYIILHSKKVRKVTMLKIENLYKHIEPYLGKAKIADLTITKFQQWRNHMDNSGLNDNYKNKINRLILSLLKHSNNFYGITSNVPAKFGRFHNPNEFKEEMKFFTYEEFEKFIAAVDEDVYKALFTTLYFMGLRQGEAQALTWKDINFTTNIMKINKTLTTKIKGEAFTISPPKTTRSRRDLLMPKIVANSLLNLKSIYETLDGFNQSCFVFGMIKPLPETSIQHKKNKICDKALGENNRIRIHDFRHSFASFMINNGANVTIVSNYLGHSNIAQTLNTYSHMFPSKQQEIIDIINKKIT